MSDSMFDESKRRALDADPLYEKALAARDSAMVIARIDRAGAEPKLLTAIDLLSKIIEVHKVCAEPYALRAGLCGAYGSISRNRTYLDNAESDYKSAIELGGIADPDYEIWQHSLSSIQMLKQIIV